ncbi:hypothetical protein [Psychrobacter immobilis]|uniref:hypothetical protein n=1 Tax=Psychrobacter immobilis TaxID=498 RepID=UPI003FD1D3BA
MAMNQKAMTDSELKIRRYVLNKKRKARASKLPVINGYTTAVCKETGFIVFSSVTDGWNFQYDADTVKRLLAAGNLQQDLNRMHDNVINERLSMNRHGFFNGLARPRKQH